MIFKLAALDFNAYKAVSIALDKYIEENGVDHNIGRDRRAFIPGEIDKVKEYTGLTDDSPEIIYLNSIWTPEVIAEYNAMIAAQEEL